jgi:hypothetical protein
MEDVEGIYLQGGVVGNSAGKMLEWNMSKGFTCREGVVRNSVQKMTTTGIELRTAKHCKHKP